MQHLLDEALLRLDRLTETMTRRMAQTAGRRSFLGKLGAILAGGALLPVLPFDQGSGTAHAAETDDPSSCDYWRYCAISGILCNDCGGTMSTCPPGSETSQVLWVGTCHNPSDGKDYLVAYNDCCGKTICNGTECRSHERERPGYRMGLYNDINWCMANRSQGYHCTLAALVGLAEE